MVQWVVDSAVECTKLGAFKYLEKPYDFDKLIEVLKDAGATAIYGSRGANGVVLIFTGRGGLNPN